MAKLSLTDISSAKRQQDEQLQFHLQYPGTIQPYGVLLVIDLKTLTIIQVSDNTKQFFGIKPKTLLGKPLKYLIPVKQIKKILAFINKSNYEFFDLIKLKKNKKTTIFKGIVHTIQESLILELEPFGLEDNPHPIPLYPQIRNAITNIRMAKNFDDLVKIIPDEIRKIVQFDRIMLYRFNFDDTGIVIAENKRDDLESYLGLHYPAHDLPAACRKFISQTWLRVIPDVTYQATSIIPHQHPLRNEELDLSHSVLRSVYPCHVEYLKNMGVRASMTIALVNENRLWGLVACHHYSPKYVNYENRKICEFLGQFLSLELLYKQEQELHQYRNQIKIIHNKIREDLLTQPQFMKEVIQNKQDSLLNLTHAQGVAICLDDQLSLIGKTPNKQQVKALINDFLTPQNREIFSTDTLEQEYPPATNFKEKSCGILSISIFLTQHNYHIIWFRHEQSQEVEWAGNPHDITLSFNEQDIPELCPRDSFVKWKEIVKGKSLPWQLIEIEAAQELRTILLQAILEEKTKQANAANLAKSQFLSKMSHELRTPLNAILGFAQMMNRDVSLSSEQQEYTGIINRSGEHLLSLINDVLEMSRIEAGQLTLNQTYFNLHELIKSVQELLTLKADSKGLVLTLDQDPELPKYLEGDEGKLRQIIVNLVDNAIKFTQEGHIDLGLSVLSQPIADSREMTFQVQVTDTGMGICEENLGIIFDAFKQTEKTYQFKDKEGTGLGLSISRQFARLMGGDITVQSQLNQGSTFTCTIKMKVPTNTEGIVKKTSQRVLALDSSQPEYRILLVEDVKDNQLLMIKMLTSVGFQVRSANNGQEALKIWQSWQPHLIWMDMRMPLMDGYEASRQIRRLEADIPNLSSPVTIIALTATAFDEEKMAILEAGCNDLVRKPCKEESIFEIMQKYLGVKYIYEDSTPTLPLKPKTSSPTFEHDKLVEEIGKMPKSWIEQLNKEALSAREKRLYHLIGQIPHEKTILAQFLRQTLQKLDFDQIINLTQEISYE